MTNGLASQRTFTCGMSLDAPQGTLTVVPTTMDSPVTVTLSDPTRPGVTATFDLPVHTQPNCARRTSLVPGNEYTGLRLAMRPTSCLVGGLPQVGYPGLTLDTPFAAGLVDEATPATTYTQTDAQPMRGLGCYADQPAPLQIVADAHGGGTVWKDKGPRTDGSATPDVLALDAGQQFFFTPTGPWQLTLLVLELALDSHPNFFPSTDPATDKPLPGPGEHPPNLGGGAVGAVHIPDPGRRQPRRGRPQGHPRRVDHPRRPHQAQGDRPVARRRRHGWRDHRLLLRPRRRRPPDLHLQHRSIAGPLRPAHPDGRRGRRHRRVGRDRRCPRPPPLYSRAAGTGLALEADTPGGATPGLDVEVGVDADGQPILENEGGGGVRLTLRRLRNLQKGRKVDFVIRRNGQMYVGHKHWMLSGEEGGRGGQPVLAAGEITAIEEGGAVGARVKLQSGTYIDLRAAVELGKEPARAAFVYSKLRRIGITNIRFIRPD